MIFSKEVKGQLDIISVAGERVKQGATLLKYDGDYLKLQKHIVQRHDTCIVYTLKVNMYSSVTCMIDKLAPFLSKIFIPICKLGCKQDFKRRTVYHVNEVTTHKQGLLHTHD